MVSPSIRFRSPCSIFGDAARVALNALPILYGSSHVFPVGLSRVVQNSPSFTLPGSRNHNKKLPSCVTFSINTYCNTTQLGIQFISEQNERLPDIHIPQGLVKANAAARRSAVNAK